MDDATRAFWRPGTFILVDAAGRERRVTKQAFAQAWARLHPQRPLPWKARDRGDLPPAAVME